MRGQKLHKRVLTKGFTIVELLIVVVVIGVLAGVISLGFNQAQIKAENAKTLQAVNQYLKAITTYSIQNGAYPVTATYPCLGTQATCARVTGSTSCFGIGTAVYNATFASDIATIVSPLPEPSTQTSNCAGNTYRGGYYNKNDTNGGKSANVIYFLRGSQVCATKYGTVTRTIQEDVTLCNVSMPTLPS